MCKGRLDLLCTLSCLKFNKDREKKEDLIGPEVRGKEGVRRERLRGAGGCSHQRLYKLMRDVAETLKPSDPDSYTQTDGQPEQTYREEKKKRKILN